MGALVCRVELNKKDGMTLTVENADGKITQTITLDGTKIEIKVKGDKETSTWTMLQDSVTIKTKTYKVQAETITCESSKDTKLTAKAKMNLESTQDMGLTSKAKMNLKATQDLNGEGMKISLKAKTDFAVEGLNIKHVAKVEAKTEATTVKIQGKAQAEIKAALATLKADGVCTVEGQLLNAKGQMANLQGSLVKIA